MESYEDHIHQLARVVQPTLTPEEVERAAAEALHIESKRKWAESKQRAKELGSAAVTLLMQHGVPTLPIYVNRGFGTKTTTRYTTTGQEVKRTGAQYYRTVNEGRGWHVLNGWKYEGADHPDSVLRVGLTESGEPFHFVYLQGQVDGRDETGIFYPDIDQYHGPRAALLEHSAFKTGIASLITHGIPYSSPR